MANATYSITYTTPDGRELPVTFSVPREKVEQRDEAYVKNAVRMAAEARYPNEFGKTPPPPDQTLDLRNAPSKIDRTGPWYQRAAQGAWDTIKAAPNALSVEQGPRTQPSAQRPGESRMGYLQRVVPPITQDESPGARPQDRMVDLADQLPFVHGLRTGDIAGTAGELAPGIVGGALTSPKVSGSIVGAAKNTVSKIQELPRSDVGHLSGAALGYAAMQGTPLARAGGVGGGALLGGVVGKVIEHPLEVGKAAVSGFQEGGAGQPITPAVLGSTPPDFTGIRNGLRPDVYQAEFADPVPQSTSGAAFNRMPPPGDYQMHPQNGPVGPGMPPPQYKPQVPQITGPGPEPPRSMGGIVSPNQTVGMPPPNAQFHFAIDPTTGAGQQVPGPFADYPPGTAPEISNGASVAPGPKLLEPSQMAPYAYRMPPAGTYQEPPVPGPIVSAPTQQGQLPEASQIQMPPGPQPPPPPTPLQLGPAEVWRGPGSVPPQYPRGGAMPAPTAAPIKAPLPPPIQSPAKPAAQIASDALATIKKPVKPPILAAQEAPKAPARPEVTIPSSVRPGWNEASLAQAEQYGQGPELLDNIDAWAKKAGKNNIQPADVRDFWKQQSSASAPAEAEPVTEDNWWKQDRKEQRKSDFIENLRSHIEDKPPAAPEPASVTPRAPASAPPKQGTMDALLQFVAKRKVLQSKQVAEAFGLPVDLTVRALQELETQGKVTRDGSKWKVVEGGTEVTPNASKISQLDPNADFEAYRNDVLGRAQQEGLEISHDDLYNLARGLGVNPTQYARHLLTNGYKVAASKFGPGDYGLSKAAKTSDPAANALVQKVLDAQKPQAPPTESEKPSQISAPEETPESQQEAAPATDPQAPHRPTLDYVDAMLKRAGYKGLKK